MASTVRTVRQWLNQFEGDDLVAVDEGGLTLVLVKDEDQYFEVGGVPEDEGPEGDHGKE